MKAQGKVLATARSRLAVVCAAKTLPPPRPGVPAAGEGHAEEVGPRAREAAETGARPDAGGMGCSQTQGRIQRVHQGKRWPKDTKTQAAMRALVEMSILRVIRDSLLPRSDCHFTVKLD